MNWNPLDHRIFETISGSKMYGTSTPISDTDYRGVCVPPMKVLLDPFHGFDQKDSGFEEEDRVIYALGKYIKLCADGNPNILELLFSPRSCWVYSKKEWEMIVDNTSLFVSKKVKHTFTGYAFSQLHKIQQHRKWFIDPPKEKPTRKQFGLTDSPRISGEGLIAVSNISFELLEPSFRDEIRRELDYREEKRSWDNYTSWLSGRNPQRQELESKFGYDTKCALHLFRLMEEGRQLLTTGEIKFPLENSEELLAIRNGKYSYDEIIEKANALETSFNEWHDNSELPYSPNWKKIEQLYFDIILE